MESAIPATPDKFPLWYKDITKEMHDELLRAHEQLSRLAPFVACFGSARIKEDHSFYQQAQSLGYRLSEAGYSVLTGGGSGLMAAANKGAQRGKSKSVGLNINIPWESPNPYLDIPLFFRHFSTRKLTFALHSKAFVVLPGGMGTMDELAEIFVLVQTKRIPKVPIVLLGVDFWEPFLDWVQTTLVRHNMMKTSELGNLYLTDDMAELMEFIEGAFHRGGL